MALKAVLFGLEHVLVNEGKGGIGSHTRSELTRLFELLRNNDIQPIILANRNWLHIDDESGEKENIDDSLKKLYGDHSLYITSRMNLPPKPRKDIVEKVLGDHGLLNKEVIYVGTSQIDFNTAINSKILFLNAIWDQQLVSYGFTLKSPIDLARFIMTFCLREHYWFYKIDTPVSYRSLSPFSTFIEHYKKLTVAARSAAKQGTNERHFFLNSLVATIHFSGLTSEFDYIACVPGHKAGFGNPVMDDVLYLLGNCFRKRYIIDLIVRHSDAPKSQSLRIKKLLPKPESQLNTIKLLKKPQKKLGENYKTQLKLSGKRVLVIDYFCTSWYSLEAPRLFLEEAGASVILMSWLKTINRDYNVLKLKDKFDPFSAQSFSNTEFTINHLIYNKYIVDRVAPLELSESFDKFKSWDWPE